MGGCSWWYVQVESSARLLWEAPVTAAATFSTFTAGYTHHLQEYTLTARGCALGCGGLWRGSLRVRGHIIRTEVGRSWFSMCNISMIRCHQPTFSGTCAQGRGLPPPPPRTARPGTVVAARWQHTRSEDTVLTARSDRRGRACSTPCTQLVTQIGTQVVTQNHSIIISFLPGPPR